MSIYYIDEAQLKHWLAHDTWSASEAMALMAGINPNSDGLFDRSGGIEPAFTDPEDPYGDDLFSPRKAKRQYDMLIKLWKSGERSGVHGNDNYFPPVYFFQWANEKKLNIPWMKEALKVGLVTLIEQEAASPALPQQPIAPAISHICSQVVERLLRAISAFQERYPDYKTKPPKLDDDVREWLMESKLCMNVSEKDVFGKILREHFKF